MKKYRIEIKWGVIFTLAALAWLALERITGLHEQYIDKHATYTNLFSIVAITIYVLALLDKRKNFYGNYMTWKQGFFSGVIISVVLAILSPLGQWISHTLIAPDYFKNIISYAVSENMMSRTEAESYFSLGNYILQSSVFALIVGIITSAVVAYFVKKNPVVNSTA